MESTGKEEMSIFRLSEETTPPKADTGTPSKHKIGRSSRLRDIIYVPRFLENLEAEQIYTARTVCKNWKDAVDMPSTMIRSLYSPKPNIIGSEFLIFYRYPLELNPDIHYHGPNYSYALAGLRTMDGSLRKYDLPEGFMCTGNATTDGLVDACDFYCKPRRSYVLNLHAKCAFRLPFWEPKLFNFSCMHFDASKRAFTYLAGRYFKSGPIHLRRYDTLSGVWKEEVIDTSMRPSNTAICSFGSFLWIDKYKDILVGYDIENARFWSMRLPRPPKCHFKYTETRGWHLKGCDGCVVLLHRPFSNNFTNLGWNAAWKLVRIPESGEYLWTGLCVPFLGYPRKKRSYKEEECFKFNIDRYGWWCVAPNYPTFYIFDNLGRRRNRISIDRFEKVLGYPNGSSYVEGVMASEVNNICWPRD